MKRTSAFLFAMIMVLLLFGQAFAGPENVSLLLVSRWNYFNVDGYGFYDKCGSSSWFGFILTNPDAEPYTLTVPDQARIGSWNGTVHPLANHRYKVMDYGNPNFLRDDRPEIPFDGKLTLPAASTTAVFVDVMNIEKYNLYWDTDLFFTVQVQSSNKTASINIEGVIAQRGNACPENEVCSAEVKSANFVSDGSGNVIVLVKNDMRDTTEVTAQTTVDLSWTDSEGKTQSRSVENAVQWLKQPGWINSGKEKTVSGTLSLPIDIAAVQRDLKLTFHFHHPSSFWFGDFSAETRLTVSGGLQGAMNGTYEADGSGGSFSAILNNYQDREVTVTLPSQGTLQAADGKTVPISLSWPQNSTLKIPSYGRSELEGSFSFSDISLIHSNSSLVISAGLTSDGGKGNAAGTVTRNPDPDPKLVSVGFCRDYTPGESKLTFAYALRNDGHIDIPVQLSGTLAVDNQPKNLAIHYTGCESGGTSCYDRINGSNFTIEPGETAVFHAEVTLETLLESSSAAVRTSLIYTPDGVTKALYVGQTSASCAAAVLVPTAAAVPTQTPTAIPTSVPTVLPTEVPTRVPTEIPTVIPTSVPTAMPTPETPPESPSLEVSVIGGSYSSCSSDISLRFLMMIRNSGMVPGELSSDRLDFRMDGEKIPVGFASCAIMTEGGTVSCPEAPDAKSFTVNPGTTLRLEAVYQPGNPIQADSAAISLTSRDLTPQRLEFTAYSTGRECEPLIEAVVLPNDTENDFSGTLSADGEKVSLTLHLTNSGSVDAEITPGTIYLHQMSVETYQGVGTLCQTAFCDPNAGSFQFNGGDAFTLPAQSSVDLELDLQEISSLSQTGETEITWNFSIGEETKNFTGSVNKPRDLRSNRSGSRPESTDETGTSVFPAAGLIPQGPLPATGFPTAAGTGRLAIRTGNSGSMALNGLRLEIPSLGISAGIAGVSLDENGEWDVLGLEDQAGLLDGTPLPGKGTAILAAHNHLDETRTGPFLSLAELEDQDRLFVSDTNGKLLIFRVYKNFLVTPEDSSVIYREAIPGSLVLLTCESELPEGGYAYRRLVFAEPLQ